MVGKEAGEMPGLTSLTGSAVSLSFMLSCGATKRLWAEEQQHLIRVRRTAWGTENRRGKTGS